MVEQPSEQEKYENKKRNDPDYALNTWVKARIISVSTKKPVAHAFILMNGTGYQSRSDVDGNFKMLIPDSLAYKPNQFRIVHPDYGRVTITSRVDEFPDFIELPPPSPRETFVTGGLTVVKRKWWQRRKK